MTEWNEAKHRESIIGWTKRMDHRHHAIDAVTIAQTSQSVIQRLNTLNASREQMLDDVQKEAAEQHFNEKKSLLQKWVDTQAHLPVSAVKEAADGILVSFRAGKRVTTPAKRSVYHGGKRTVVQTGLQVPRGALSEETVYGKQGDKYVVKYPLTHPSMKPENIIDPTIRQLVIDRIQANDGNQKTAFAEPLYSAKGMEIQSVRCYTGLKDESMRAVRCNEQGEGIGFVKTGNNHHIAIYKDTDGKYHEQVVSFWDAVERKHYGIPVVIENPQAMWDTLTNMDDQDLPSQEFLETLPLENWQLVVSMQQNEMFILGMEDSDYATAMENKDYQTLNKYLYRVQKLGAKNYFFRYHVETSVDDKYNGKPDYIKSTKLNKIRNIQSIDSYFAQHPHKVRINILGEISEL